jgi:hypothetical protein
METYAFLINCKLAVGINEHEFSLILPDPSPPVQVKVPKRGSRPVLILRCGGFTSEDEARATGVRVKTAVMLAGVRMGFGIDVGPDQVITRNEYLRPDVHGLQVGLERQGPSVFASVVSGHLIPKNFPESFQKGVAECYALNKIPTKKQTLAAQLYNQSHFSSSDAA